MTEQFQSTLEEWHRRVARSAWAHRQAEAMSRLWRAVISIALVVIVGTIGAIGSDAKSHYFYLIGPFSVVAAALAAAQLYFDFGVRALNHKRAGDLYASLRRELEQLATGCPADETARNTKFDEVRKRTDELADQCPALPMLVWRSAEQRFDRRNYKSSLFKSTVSVEKTSAK